MPPGNTSPWVASIVRSPPAKRSARATMRPPVIPMSQRVTPPAVATVPPEITRSNVLMVSSHHHAIAALCPEGHALFDKSEDRVHHDPHHRDHEQAGKHQRRVEVRG